MGRWGSDAEVRDLVLRARQWQREIGALVRGGDPEAAAKRMFSDVDTANLIRDLTEVVELAWVPPLRLPPEG
jgi:hypothetical protein